MADVVGINLVNIINRVVVTEQISRLWTFYRHPYICNMPIAHEKAQLLGNGKIRFYLEDNRGTCFTEMVISKRKWQWQH